MKVAIVGADGLVGKELARQFGEEHEVRTLTHRELDVTNASLVQQVLFSERPHLIINCAVLGVAACEIDPDLAWSVNVVGAENLANAARELDADFLQLSTNYVFDGKLANGLFYTVEDIPRPVNVYGQTKLAGEHAVMAACSRCFVVRTSWVFGNGKPNFFSSAHRSLRNSEKIRAVTDVSASVTNLRHLASRIKEIVSRRHYSTYQVVNEGCCSYYSFAWEAGRVIGLPDSRLSELIEPVLESAHRHDAPRPPYTPMRCLASEDLRLPPLPVWSLALAEYIREDLHYE